MASGKDGASGYRLDWNGMSFVWTGDGRPSELDVKYDKGVDLYVTETQAELMSTSSGVAGVPPFVGRYAIDTHHTPPTPQVTSATKSIGADIFREACRRQALVLAAPGAFVSQEGERLQSLISPRNTYPSSL